MSALILTPLKKELTFLLNALNAKGAGFNFQKDGRIYYSKKLNAYLSIGGHGKVQFAVKTMHFLSTLKSIEKVFCVGAGGGLSKKIKILDLFIAEKIIEHDYNLKFIKKKLPEFQTSVDLVRSLLSLDVEFNVLSGVSASGDEDIVTEERALEIHKKTAADVVSWEGVGGAKACENFNIPYVEVRAVTDMCSENASEDFFKNLEEGMKKAANLIYLYCLI